jgi:hypothetical protein
LSLGYVTMTPFVIPTPRQLGALRGKALAVVEHHLDADDLTGALAAMPLASARG